MKKLRLLTGILLLVLLIGIAPTVRAEGMAYGVSPKTATLKEGAEITIKLDVSAIDMGEDGINTFGGKLVYDETIFEKVTSANFAMQNNWTIVYNDEETDKKGTFLATNMTGVKQDQEIGTVKLKVKTNLKSTKTEVKFTQISSVGENTVELGDTSVELTIEGTVKDEQPIKPNTNTNNDTQKPTTNTPKKDNTTSNNKIPQTGVESTMITVAVLALVLVAIVSYVQFRKHKNI